MTKLLTKESISAIALVASLGITIGRPMDTYSMVTHLEAVTLIRIGQTGKVKSPTEEGILWMVTFSQLT